MPSSEIKEILGKAQHFCSYQERCTREVQRRLVILGASEAQREEVIRILKEEGFLDDQRFAREYAHGKFRNNQWGKVKIRLELTSRGIPFSETRDALNVIDDEEYMQTIRNLVAKKFDVLKTKNASHIREKVASFLSQKGFESDLIWQVIKTTC
jgi:regulatory protein